LEPLRGEQGAKMKQIVVRKTGTVKLAGQATTAHQVD
jgi:hypothetical protein